MKIKNNIKKPGVKQKELLGKNIGKSVMDLPQMSNMIMRQGMAFKIFKTLNRHERKSLSFVTTEVGAWKYHYTKLWYSVEAVSYTHLDVYKRQ